MPPSSVFFFFFNDTATTEIYTLSLHDALPISQEALRDSSSLLRAHLAVQERHEHAAQLRFQDVLQKFQGDRKSTRLNSSHSQISYAVFCLKKKTAIRTHQSP